MVSGHIRGGCRRPGRHRRWRDGKRPVSGLTARPGCPCRRLARLAGPIAKGTRDRRAPGRRQKVLEAMPRDHFCFVDPFEIPSTNEILTSAYGKAAPRATESGLCGRAIRLRICALRYRTTTVREC